MLKMIMTFSFVVTMAVYSIANLLPLNDRTTWEIADRLPVLFTPAGYVFSIWIGIYILLGFWIYGFNVRTRSTASRTRLRAVLFIFSCLFNVAWVILWHYSYYTPMLCVKVILLGLLLALYFTYPPKENSIWERVPISVYVGWIFISTIMNFNYVLTYREWSGWGLSDPLWTVIYLTIATAFAFHFLYHHKDIGLNIVIVWAFIGIIVKNGIDELFVSAAALFLTAALIVGILMTRKSKHGQEIVSQGTESIAE
ncbi:tryptophan-rich sensory protein [Sporosarcina sp. 179-K 3D1 HS]|uniref:tryptophan-rich sensory protein n=1 Tax=Sporosarcina sp. 179-K 3D1 HS TaxID=3232169 RepID=UPI00399F6CB0